MGFRNESKNLCILEYWLFSHFGLEILMSTSETTTQQYFFFKKKQYPIHLYISAPPGPYPIRNKTPQEIKPGKSKKLCFTKN